MVAAGLGRVVQFSAGAPPRLCGVGNPNTLALSRALGDNCELGERMQEEAAWPNLGPPAVGVTSCGLQACSAGRLPLQRIARTVFVWLAVSHVCAAGALPMGLTAEPDAVTVALPPPAPSTPGPRAAAVPGGIDSLSTDTEEQDAAGSSGDGSSSSSGSRDSGCGGSSSSISSIGRAEAAPARHVLLVACDGLWDYVTNQEAVDIALRCAEGVGGALSPLAGSLCAVPGWLAAAASCTSALPASHQYPC